MDAPAVCVAGHRLDAAEFRRFLKHFDTFGNQLAEVRYTSDHLDVVVVAAWAQRRRKDSGIATALLGVTIMAHFNRLRIFGMLESALRSTIDWNQMLAQLERCGWY